MEKFKVVPKLRKLIPLRASLLTLHSELLVLQRQKYEDLFGRIRKTGEYFSLVMDHPAFQWLRGLSILIVSMDELMSGRKPVEEKQVDSLVAYIKALLKPHKEGNEFEKNYYDALQKFPGVALAHGRVMQEIMKLNLKQ